MSSWAKWIVVLVMGLAVASAAPVEESEAVTPTTPRIVAEGTTYALDAVEPVILAVPPLIAEQVQGETALFYFSPTCPHCQQAMPEINALVGSTTLKWIGIASGGSTAEERADFERDYTPDFEVLHDVDRLLAAVGVLDDDPVLVDLRHDDDPVVHDELPADGER
ncbi:MAG: redoxin domain-containing protein, partial [Myxococcota bacterium]|nr:redoxin domain-containing protein [Myxococcota bacterium]